jgi:hypothetical protein
MVLTTVLAMAGLTLLDMAGRLAMAGQSMMMYVPPDHKRVA